MALTNGGSGCPPGFYYDKTFLQCLPNPKCRPGSLEEMLGLCQPDPREVTIEEGAHFIIRLRFPQPVSLGPTFNAIMSAGGFEVIRETTTGSDTAIEVKAKRGGYVKDVLDNYVAILISALRAVGITALTVLGISYVVAPQETSKVVATFIKETAMGMVQGAFEGITQPPKKDTDWTPFIILGGAVVLLTLLRR